jgi:hypothetical protein
MADFSSIRDSDGKLPAHAWPGGYVIIYIADDGATICPDCANSGDFRESGPADGFRLDAYTTHDEGPPEICASCNKEIPSSYSEKCTSCGGRGDLDGIGEREIDCPDCNGSGWI